MSFTDRYYDRDRIRRVHFDSSARRRGESPFADKVVALLWSSVWITGFLLGCRVTYNVGHVFYHSYERHTDVVESAARYVAVFCDNDELVRQTKKYRECEIERLKARRSPLWESVSDALDLFQWCVPDTPVHEEDVIQDHHHSSDHGTTHCDHSNYIMFGAFIAIIIICILRKVVNSINGGSRESEK